MVENIGEKKVHIPRPIIRTSIIIKGIVNQQIFIYLKICMIFFTIIVQLMHVCRKKGKKNFVKSYPMI